MLCNLLTRLVSHSRPCRLLFDTRYLMFQNNSKFSALLSTTIVSRKANAKIRPFFELQNFFFTFPQTDMLNSYESRKIFFHFFLGSWKSIIQKWLFHPFFPYFDDKKPLFVVDNAACNYNTIRYIQNAFLTTIYNHFIYNTITTNRLTMIFLSFLSETIEKLFQKFGPQPYLI